jgi:CYTH domain-containing protein
MLRQRPVRLEPSLKRSAKGKPRKTHMTSPPPYSKPEYERRWLVPADAAFESHAERERQIEDRYIQGTRLRLRKVTEFGQATIYKLGKKYKPEALGKHHVVTIYLSEAEYNMFASLPARIASKQRFTVNGGALDVYEKPNSGLRVFEVEFSTAEEAENYAPPLGIDQEITNELELTGYSLAGPA